MPRSSDHAPPASASRDRRPRSGRGASACTEQTLPTRHGRVLTIWTPEDKAFWETAGPRHRPAQSVDLGAVPVPGLRRLAAVERGGRQPERARLPLHHRPAVLARRCARAVGRDAAHLLFVHGADLRRPALDRAIHRQPADPGHRHRHRSAGSDHQLSHDADPGAAVRAGRRQLRLLHGQHQLLLPQGAQGLGAGGQRRPGQSRRVLGAVSHAAGGHHGHLRRAGRRPADDRRSAWTHPARSGRRTPPSSGCRSSRLPRSSPGSG